MDFELTFEGVRFPSENNQKGKAHTRPEKKQKQVYRGVTTNS